MRMMLLMALLICSFICKAQFTKSWLQAGGLTCPMCSKAVKEALEEVGFVQGVTVNLNTLEFELVFNNSERIDFDKLRKAVEDAGFSIVSFKASANFNGQKIEKDGFLQLDNQAFYVLNLSDVLLNGVQTITVVDKHFVSPKVFKKYSAAILQRKGNYHFVYHILI